MISRFLALTLICLLPCSALARLGENHDQCDARYGPKWQPGAAMPWSSDIRVYEKNGLRVTITFINGTAGRITVTTIDPPALAADQALAIMEANGSGRTWKATGKQDGGVSFACFDDKTPYALCVFGKSGLQISTVAFATAAGAAIDEQRKKSVAGF